MNLTKLANKFIFTPTCFVCAAPLPFSYKMPYICDKCSIKAHLINIKICECCKKPRDIDPLKPACPYCNGDKFPFDNYISPFYYEGAIRLSIRDYKFTRRFGNAKSFAHFMAIKLKYLDNFKPEVIIPAPSSKRRIISRGFNHTLLLAKHLSEMTDIPYDNVLVKIRHTKPQSLLTRKERETNLKGAFDIKPHNYKNVLLIDDIYTTGSTVKELCKVLRKSGVKEISVATVAHTYYSENERLD